MTPTFFLADLYVGSFSCFSYTIHIGSNWYRDTGVCDLEVALFKAYFLWFLYNLIIFHLQSKF